MSVQKLLLLHGALGAASQFDELKTELEKDFEVLTYNFPGHGGREIPGEPFSFHLFVSDLTKFLQEKNISTINIFGYSMGGYAALWMAAKNHFSINRIFTLATKLDWNPDSSAREASMLNPEKMEEKIPSFANALAARHAPSHWKEVVNKTREMILNLGNNHLLEKDLSAIKQSVTISVGEKDTMVSMQESQHVAEMLPNGNFHSFQEMQHPFEKVNLKQLIPVMRTFFIER